MYVRPSENCDFTKLNDYRLLVSNSEVEDPNLLELVKSTHYEVAYIFDKTELNIDNTIKLSPKTINSEGYYDLKFISKTFECLNDVIQFVKEESKNNYFFMLSYVNLKLEYATMSYSYRIRGMEDYRRDRLCESLINI